MSYWGDLIPIPTIADLHRVAYRARDPSVQSHLNCGSVSDTIRSVLNETFGPIADIGIGTVTKSPTARRGWGAEHAFVHVPAKHVTEDVGVILDGTLDQFSISQWEHGYVPIGLLPAENFPPRVSVLTRTGIGTPDAVTGLYDHFFVDEWQHPIVNDEFERGSRRL